MIISGDPPKLTFSLTILKDFSILCDRRCTKASCNDLIIGFSHKVEMYSQVYAVLQGLRMCEHKIQEEFKQASRNIDDIVESADMDDCFAQNFIRIVNNINHICFVFSSVI